MLFCRILCCGLLCFQWFFFCVSPICPKCCCFHFRRMKTRMQRCQRGSQWVFFFFIEGGTHLQSMCHILALDFNQVLILLSQTISILCAAALSSVWDSLELVWIIAVVLPPCGKRTPFPLLNFVSIFALTFCGKLSPNWLFKVWVHWESDASAPSWPIKQLLTYSPTPLRLFYCSYCSLHCSFLYPYIMVLPSPNKFTPAVMEG